VLVPNHKHVHVRREDCIQSQVAILRSMFGEGCRFLRQEQSNRNDIKNFEGMLGHLKGHWRKIWKHHHEYLIIFIWIRIRLCHRMDSHSHPSSWLASYDVCWRNSRSRGPRRSVGANARIRLKRWIRRASPPRRANCSHLLQ